PNVNTRKARNMCRHQAGLDFMADPQLFSQFFSIEPFPLCFLSMAQESVEGFIETKAQLIDLKPHPVGLISHMCASFRDPLHRLHQMVERPLNAAGEKVDSASSNHSDKKKEARKAEHVGFKME